MINDPFEMMQKTPFSRINLIGLKLRVIDRRLRLLATINDSAFKATTDEPVEVIRTRLLLERESLVSEFTKLFQEQDKHKRLVPAEPIVSSGASGFLSGVLQSTHCDSQDQNLKIESIQNYCFFAQYDWSDGSYSDFSSFSETWYESNDVFALFGVRDPNFDIWNADANIVVVIPIWSYVLPERNYLARYDLSLSSSLMFTWDAAGTTAFNAGYLSLYVSGHMTMTSRDQGYYPVQFYDVEQTEYVYDDYPTIVELGPKPLSVWWETGMPNIQADTNFTRSVEVGANESRKVIVAFPTLIAVDRLDFHGRLRVSVSPTLSCSITAI